VHDRIEPEPVGGAEHDLRATNVHRVHFVRPPRIERIDRGGVEDSVAALQRALDGHRIGYVADARLDLDHTVGGERSRDAVGSSRQDPDPVAGLGDRRNGVRTHEARSSGHEHKHMGQPLAGSSSRVVDYVRTF
jgi:hypothetical protein